MAWQGTTILARIGRSLGLRRRWAGAAAVARARGVAARKASSEQGLAARAYARALARLPEADRFALVKLVIDLDHEGTGVVHRALASGAPASAVIALARSWRKLTPVERAIAVHPIPIPVEGPVTLAGTHARQIDSTTCGAASMAMMLMVGDPFVGLWLASGTTYARYLPPEVERIRHRGALRNVEARWGALQRSIHAETVRRGLLMILPWPRRLGTPPWRVNNHTRFVGLRFQGAIVDDTDDADIDALIAHASAALSDGIPVPLYASGDSDKGLDAVIPRHVVLLTHRFPGGFFAYEPSSGQLHELSDVRIREGGVALAALGNWTHVSWMVLPVARQR